MSGCCGCKYRIVDVYIVFFQPEHPGPGWYCSGWNFLAALAPKLRSERPLNFDLWTPKPSKCTCLAVELEYITSYSG